MQNIQNYFYHLRQIGRQVVGVMQEPLQRFPRVTEKGIRFCEFWLPNLEENQRGE